MHKGYYIVVASLVVVGIAVSYLITLRPSELAFMKFQDRQFEQSFADFKELYNKGDHSVNVVVPLTKLYLQYGDVANAIKLMEQFIKDNPESAIARQQLGVYYQYAQRPEDYLRNLEELRKLKPSPELLRELSDIYNFHADYDRQIAVLEQLIKQYHLKAKESDYVNLAYLYGSKREFSKAFSLLKALMAEKETKDLGSDTVELAVTLMVDAGQQEKALAMAKEYLKHHQKAENIVRFLERFQQKGEVELASQLARPYEYLLQSNPEVFVQMMSLQISKDQSEEVYKFMVERFGEGTFPEKAVETLIDLAASYDDHVMLGKILDKDYELENLHEETLMGFAQVAIAERQPELARKVKKKLGKDFLQYNSLLLAVLDLAEFGPSQMDKVLKVQKERPLSTSQKVSLMGVYNRVGYYYLSYDLLLTIPVLDVLVNFDSVQLVNLFLKMDKTGQAFILLRKAKLEIKDAFVQKKIDHVYLLLSAASGKKNNIVDWLSRESKLDPQLVTDAYFISLQHKQYEISLEVARWLYTYKTSDEHRKARYRSYYADALVYNKQYEQALELLREIVKKNKEVEYPYIRALSALIKKGGEKTKEYKEELDAVLTRMYERKETTDKERRELAYVLVDAGFKDRAATIFYKLAQKAPDGSKEVDQVLYLWGKHPAPDGLDWIRHRATAASTAERKKFLDYLVYNNRPDDAISIIEQTSASSMKDPKIMDSYFDALNQTKDKKRLREVLEREISREQEFSRLKRLGVRALQEGELRSSEKAFRKAFALRPDDMDVIKNLGMVCFFQGNYTEAERLLLRYISSNPSDYKVNFYYGEMMWRRKKYDEAEKYYKKSEESINKLTKKDVEVQIVESYLQFRQNKVKRSLEMFQSLLRMYPANYELRATFANILMEMDEFVEAERVLSGS